MILVLEERQTTSSSNSSNETPRSKAEEVARIICGRRCSEEGKGKALMANGAEAFEVAKKKNNVDQTEPQSGQMWKRINSKPENFMPGHVTRYG